MKANYLYWLLLLFFVVLMYWAAVFSREVTLMSGVNWEPLWTYRAIIEEEQDNLIGEIVTNVLMFIPIGTLLELIVGNGAMKNNPLKGWMVALGFGVVLSLGIELLQWYLKVGLCETDDIIHNTIGCLLGYAVVCLFEKMIARDDTSFS